MVELTKSPKKVDRTPISKTTTLKNTIHGVVHKTDLYEIRNKATLEKACCGLRYTQSAIRTECILSPETSGSRRFLRPLNRAKVLCPVKDRSQCARSTSHCVTWVVTLDSTCVNPATNNFAPLQSRPGTKNTSPPRLETNTLRTQRSYLESSTKTIIFDSWTRSLSRVATTSTTSKQTTSIHRHPYAFDPQTY